MPHRSSHGFLTSLALVGVVGVAQLIARRSPPLAPSEDTESAQPRREQASSKKADPAEKERVTQREPDAAEVAEKVQRNWKDILLGVYHRINDDRLLAVAAGVVFYGLLALFPAITALVSSYALFADGRTINEHLSLLAGLVPEGAFSVIRDQVERVLAKGQVKLGAAFLFSLALAVWSANGGMKAVIDALNVVYGETDRRGFIKLNLVSLAFTLGGLAAALCAIGLVVAAPVVLNTIGLGGLAKPLIDYGRWPALALMTLLGMAVLYRFAPDRRTPKWQWVSPGSLLATVTWLIGSAALSYYLANFADYDATYGSLGAAIGLMVWMWMTTIVVLLGAELNSEIEDQFARSAPDAPERLRGGFPAKHPSAAAQ